MKRRTLLVSSSIVLAGLGIGAIYWPTRWKYIVVHHSAGSYGNIEFLQKVHRERQKADPINAIPYHYVIGNGNGLGLGEIDSDWRQEYNLWGTHVSANNLDRNFRGVGICLIGDFEQNQIPKKQYDALVALTKGLMARYSITANNVSGHGHIDGEHTKCPGKNFPMEAFMSDIKSAADRP